MLVVEHTSRVGRLEVAAILNKLKVLVVFFSEYLAGNCDKNNKDDNALENMFVTDDIALLRLLIMAGILYEIWVFTH